MSQDQEFTPESVAVENVESLIRGELIDPTPGTLAHRVLEWAKGLNHDDV